MIAKRVPGADPRLSRHCKCASAGIVRQESLFVRNVQYRLAAWIYEAGANREIKDMTAAIVLSLCIGVMAAYLLAMFNL